MLKGGLVFLLLLFRISIWDENRILLSSIKELKPDVKGEISRKLLKVGENSSLHVVWIKTREKPHYHAKHDLTVILVRGKGTFWVAGIPLEMKEGDIVFVPAKVVHWFENKAKDKSVAVVIFSPAFDGKDRVFVDQEQHKKESSE